MPSTFLRVLLAVSLVTGWLVAVAAPAQATHDVTPARVAGADRYDTAADVARLQFPDGADNAVIATGEEFADGLAGTALSGAADAPVLLVEQDRIPEPTAVALDELGVTNVYVLGGSQAISPLVEERLREDRDVARLEGQTRYGTAAAVAREIGRIEASLGRVAGLTTAFVASGETFVDALAAGSLATTQASTAFPILLVGQDTYPTATEAVINELGIEQVFIVGGAAAVSDTVQQQLDDDTMSAVRLAGPTRYETAVEVADFGMQEFDYDGRLTVIARGDRFPDALTIGLHAGRNDAPILLTGSQGLPRATHSWLHDMCPAVDVVRAVGGTSAVPAATLEEAEVHAEHCHAGEGQTGTTFLVEPSEPAVTVPAGRSVDLSVDGRVDRRPAQDPLDVALFPCSEVDNARFADADDDGFADAIASTDTGAARITSALEATRVDERYAHNLRFLVGSLSWTLHSDAADCTVTVLFDDIDGDDRLPLDSEGNPLEHFGTRRVVWASDSGGS